MIGAGALPQRSLLVQIANEAYNSPPRSAIGPLKLFYATPTVKFYKDGNTIVVGVRGTYGASDIAADSLIALNKLSTSSRFKNDLRTLQSVLRSYPASTYDYYGVGHSLGGAILDIFLKMGLIKRAVSYNPAIQPQDIKGQVANERVYSENDPLYKIYKHTGLAQAPEVRAQKPKKWWENIIESVPYVGTAYKGFTDHLLDNFSGGGKKQDFKSQLGDVGISPSTYLEKARRRAKESGYEPKMLGLSDDGEHKLVIADDKGRLVRFGRVGYGDFIIWSHLEESGKAPKGKASQKRNTFHKSHSKIRGDWEKYPFSPNNLALRILW
jgi:hypothetical protein